MVKKTKYNVPEFYTNKDFVSEPEHYFTLETFELYKLARDYRKKIYTVINALPPHLSTHCINTIPLFNNKYK